MTSLSGSTIRVLLVAFILGGVALIHPNLNAPAQEKPPQYTVEEYGAYQAITGEPDPAKKMDLILKFFKEYPKSELQQHITADFQSMLKSLSDAKKWPQVVTAGRQFLSVVPGDTYTIALVADAYSASKNYPQFVIFGEEAYRANPSGNLAYAIAKAYKEIGNNAKFVEWGEKTVSKLPDNYEIMLQMAIIYSDNQRTAEADKYAKQCLKVIQAAKRPEQMAEKDWTTYTTGAFTACYYIIGTAAYQNQQFPAAIPNLENSIKYNPRNDYAYYWLGMSYWQTRNTSMALKNFAKAMLLNGRSAAPAKQQLENLWRQTHQNSLMGLDKVIAAARAELEMK
ncbi:MAG: tetratricopeptide repeat protein [Acidobacteriia bacterium]|nr:tetratricopeptide repeat protein [Terriglobia bacterium]